MKSSERNISPAIAPQSQGLSEPLTSMSPKMTAFQSLGSIPSGMFSPSLTKRRLSEAKQGSDPLNSPTHSIMSSPKLWQKASISRLAEEFFWIGGSVVAQPKWRLGQMGKTLTSEIHITFFFFWTEVLKIWCKTKQEFPCKSKIQMKTMMKFDRVF